VADAVAAGVEPFVHRFRVRYRECDPQGRVFSGNYIGFVEDAATELWRARLGGYAALAAEGVDLVVAESGIRYRRPAVADDILDVELAIEALEETAMVMAFLISRDGARVAIGELTYVFIDAATQRRTSVPPAVRAAISPLVAP
jgi:acyl-CoA thioester hydrolase